MFGSVVHATGDDTILGSALIVAGSLFWAFFAILIKPYTERLSGIDVGAELLEHRHDQPVLLVEQREQEVRRSDLCVVVLGGEPLGRGDGLLGLGRETVWLHA